MKSSRVQGQIHKRLQLRKLRVAQNEKNWGGLGQRDRERGGYA